MNACLTPVSGLPADRARADTPGQVVRLIAVRVRRDGDGGMVGAMTSSQDLAGLSSGAQHGRRVLVIGATGYIGSRLVPRLITDGAEVSVCLLYTSPSPRD